MLISDQLQFCWQHLSRQRFRTLMIGITVALSVASVLMLTALGEGARNLVKAEFAFLGSDMLVTFPGRKETTGGAPPITGTTLRDLTLADMNYLQQQIPHIRAVPLVAGTAEARAAGRARESMILGTTRDFFITHNLRILRGQPLPKIPADQGSPVCVVGTELKAALFGNDTALGQWLRIGDTRFRVIGEFTSDSSNMAIRFDETALIPAASAQRLFNTPGLFRLFVQATAGQPLLPLKKRIESLIQARHQGVLDVTVLQPDAMLATFDRILATLTLTVAGIGTVSLVVAGILLMNITLISTHQRIGEIGLLIALGATPAQIRNLILTEAAIQAGIGGALGLSIGIAGVMAAQLQWPLFPLAIPLWAQLSAPLMALLVGLIFAALPARRAARLDPVVCLRSPL